MTTGSKSLRLCGALFTALTGILLCLGGNARAGAAFDLGAAPPGPPLPSLIDSSLSPVYITNSNASGQNAGAGDVDALVVGARTTLHVGYGAVGVAAGSVAVNVKDDMRVDGRAHFGKDATNGAPGLPNAAAAKAISLDVGGNLGVSRGGIMSVNGASDAEAATVKAGTLELGGGTMVLENFATLTTGMADAPGTGSDRNRYSTRIWNGGRLLLDGGIPAVTKDASGKWVYDPTWIFKGLTVAAGGDGILLEKGGAIVAGTSGGVVRGVSGQRLESRRGSMVDAGRGDLLALGMGSVILGGGYRAGYRQGVGTTLLRAEDGVVVCAPGSVLSLSRDLARHLNTSGAAAFEQAVILRGRTIDFSGGVPVLHTGMGSYSLALERTGGGSDPGWEHLRATGVENAVQGSNTAADRETFRANVERIWHPGRLNADQADNMYALSALADPGITVFGEGGRLNQAVLEAFVDGRNQAAGAGYADAGLFEMYNGGAQWGVNAVALNTAGEFMAGLDRRVDRLGAEMDRVGEGWIASDAAFGSCADPDARENRIWIGGFGRNEEAGLDYGIAGYTYRPRGFMAGYDKRFGSLAIGAAFAFGRGNYEDRAATANDSKITGYSGGLYGAYHFQGGLNLSGFAAYSHLDNDLDDRRGGMRRTADHSSYAWSLGGRVGYDMLMTEKMLLSPSVGLTRVRAVNRSHDEFLDGAGVLRIGEARRNSTLLPLDVAVSYDLLRSPAHILRLTTNLGYAYDFTEGGLDGRFAYEGLEGATTMRIANRKPGRNRYTLGAGLLYTGARLDVGARYDYFRRSEQENHQLKGSLGVKF